MKQLSRIHAVLATAIAVNLLALVVLVVTFVRHDDRWAPLYGYQDQEVLTPTVTVDDPTAPAFVTVEAVKCATSDVVVTGGQSWLSQPPHAGTVIRVSVDAVAKRVRGCTVYRYTNPVPAPVIAATATLGGTVSWRIVGVETPTRDGSQGVPAPWRTDPFTITTPTVPPAG